MAREKRARERAHLAQKSLFDSYGKPTKKKIILPPLPTPSPEDILYCGTEPDFESLYFSLYEELAQCRYRAEKSGRFDSAALKEKAKRILQAIEENLQATNNTSIHDVFHHLAELVSDYFIQPTEITFEHLIYFLSKHTLQQRDTLYGGWPLPYEPAELEPLFEGWSELNEFPTLISSYSKITAVLDEANVTAVKKYPDSPNSEETLSPPATPPYTQKPTQDREERKNHCEEETPLLPRLGK